MVLNDSLPQGDESVEFRIHLDTAYIPIPGLDLWTQGYWWARTVPISVAAENDSRKMG